MSTRRRKKPRSAQANAHHSMAEVKRRARVHEKEQWALPRESRRVYWLRPRTAKTYQYIESWLTNCTFEYVRLKERGAMKYNDPDVYRAHKREVARRYYHNDNPFWWAKTAGTVKWPFRAIRSNFLSWLLVGLKGHDKQIEVFKWLDNELEAPNTIPPITEEQLCKLIHVKYPDEFSSTFNPDGYIR